MKKLAVFLILCFSVWGRLFSDDGFSWDANVRMGTMVDFVEDESTDMPRIQPYGGDKRGVFNLHYWYGALYFKTILTGVYYGNVYEKDNGAVIFSGEALYRHPENFFTFYLSSFLVYGRGGDKGAFWAGAAMNDWDRETPSHKGPTRMWIQFNALENQKLRIYASYIGRDDGDIDDGFNGDWNVSDLVKDEKFSMNPIPWQAALQLNYSGIENLVFGATFAGEGAFAGYKLLPDEEGVVDKSRYDFFRSFLWGHTVFGAKYAFGRLNLGAMLGLDIPWSANADKYGDTLYHAYLGANYTLDNGIYLHGDIKGFDLEGDRLFFAGVGASYWMDSRAMWFELNLRLRDINFAYRDIGPMENLIRVVNIEPLFAWNIIPDSLQFRLPLNINMDWTGQEMTVSIGPGFFYNLRHDGAGDDPAHGFYIRYNLGYQLTNPAGSYTNNLEMAFRMAM